MPSAYKPFGFLVVLLLWGLGIGFAVIQFSASSHGYSWDSKDYLTPTLATMATGGVVGLILGFHFDRKLSEFEARRTLIVNLWALLLFGCLMFDLILPVIAGAREKIHFNDSSHFSISMTGTGRRQFSSCTLLLLTTFVIGRPVRTLAAEGNTRSPNETIK